MDLEVVSSSDLAWLAGWLEGEGSFVLSDGRPKIIASCTDEDVVEKAARICGGYAVRGVAPRNGRQQWQYRFSVTGESALRIMEAIRPHMGWRRGDKIDELLGVFA